MTSGGKAAQDRAFVVDDAWIGRAKAAAHEAGWRHRRTYEFPEPSCRLVRCRECAFSKAMRCGLVCTLRGTMSFLTKPEGFCDRAVQSRGE